MYSMLVGLLDVLLATLASMAVGMVWYSPLLFGTPWMKLMNFNSQDMSKKKGVSKLYMLAAVASFVQAFVLALMVYAVGSKTILQHILLAFWLWLGFVVPGFFTQVIFENKKPQLFLISIFYQLASMVVMAAVLWLI